MVSGENNNCRINKEFTQTLRMTIILLNNFTSKTVYIFFHLRFLVTTEGKVENLNLVDAITRFLRNKNAFREAKIGGSYMKMISKENLKLLMWKKYQQTGPSITSMTCYLYLTFNETVV